MRKKAVKSILIILSILCLGELFGVYRRSALSEENFFSSLFQRGSLDTNSRFPYPIVFFPRAAVSKKNSKTYPA